MSNWVYQNNLIVPKDYNQPITLFQNEDVFLPSSFTDCVAWYRADLGVTTGVIFTWANQIPGDTNTNLIQAVAASQPTLSSAYANLNGQPAIVFDGVNDTLKSLVWVTPLAQPCTWYWVSYETSSGADHVVFDGITGANRQACQANLASDFYQVYSGTAVLVAGGKAALNTTRIGCFLMTAGTASDDIFVDCFATPTNSGNTGTVSLTGLQVGSSFVPSGFFPGAIAEIIAFNTKHTQAQRQIVMEYLGDRYAHGVGPA